MRLFITLAILSLFLAAALAATPVYTGGCKEYPEAKRQARWTYPANPLKQDSSPPTPGNPSWNKYIITTVTHTLWGRTTSDYKYKISATTYNKGRGKTLISAETLQNEGGDQVFKVNFNGKNNLNIIKSFWLKAGNSCDIDSFANLDELSQISSQAKVRK